MLSNIMEAVEREDSRVDKIPFIDRNLWLEVQESLIDARSKAYPTIGMCLECDRVDNCRYVQAEIVGFYYYFCGIKNREWRK